MLIGISGKIGSGKDTIGKIIQYLDSYCNTDYSFDQFVNTFENNTGFQTTWQIKKMAGKLKEIISLLTGIPVEDLEKQEVKDMQLGPEWYTFIGLKEVMKDGVGRRPYTVRELLQRVGTEAMRNQIHPNVWVNALFADYKFEGCRNNGGSCETPNGDCNSNLCYPNWLITDIRFPNEAEAVKERGGVLVRVNRYPKTLNRARNFNDVYENPFDKSNPTHMLFWEAECLTQHPSENSLDNYEFQYVIENDGTLEELIVKVSIVYKQIQESWKK